MFFIQVLILFFICNGLNEGSPVSSVDIGQTRLKLEPEDVIVGYKKANQSNLCSTPGCTAAANSVLKNMDPTINPCDNFYLFACGKFLNKTKILDAKSEVNGFTTATDELNKKLNMSFTEPESRTDIKPYKMVKQLYKSCMDEKRIEKLGLDPMKKMLKKLGGWPVLEENWNEKSFDWKKTVYKLRREGFGINYFLDLSVKPGLKNSTDWRILIDAPNHFGIKRKYLVKGLEEPLVKTYQRYMADIATAFGVKGKSAAEELRKSLKFEMNLANISNSFQSYKILKSNISEMQQNFSSIPWLEYTNKILAPTNKVSDSEVIFVESPNYWKQLEILLNTTSKRTQANYIMWRTVASSISYLSENVRKYERQFLNKLTNNTDTERKPRWKECFNTVMNKLPIAVNSLYVKRFFEKNDKKKISDMVKAIRQEMHKILSSLDWLDEKTSKNAIAKLELMISHVAYPAELLDAKKMENFHAKLNIPKNDYFGSTLRVNKFTYENYLSELHKPTKKTDWTTHSYIAMVNAYYSPWKNSITIPAGILQGAFFSNDRPKYMNYGAIGFVIGHEITHGFDNNGMKFDKNGNLSEWWDPKTREKFLAKAQCIIDQYGNYSVEETGTKLNGSITQGENIADNGGIKEAYYAYQSWAKKNGPEFRLPGLQNYSPQQMFWLSAANMWCTKYGIEALKLQIADEHSPAAFRIIGSLSNNKEFSNDYNCPLGSKMNPKKKCNVW